MTSETLIYKIDYETAEKNIQIYDKELKKAALFLKSGKLVVFPTETVYGMGADALNKKAVRSIFEVKGRPNDNPLIVHLADKKDIDDYAVSGNISKILIEKFMPGPCTVVLRRKNNISDIITGKRNTVAVRIPSNTIARRLIEFAETPIAAPSANLSGKPSPTQLSHIKNDLNGKVSLLIDGGRCKIGLESTVLSTNETDTVNILRPGAITKEMLVEVFGDAVNINTAKTISDKNNNNVYVCDNESPESPGMKYKHYAPKAPLFLIKDSKEHKEGKFTQKIFDFMIKKVIERKDKNIGLMCFDEDIKALKNTLTPNSSNFKILSIGHSEDYDEQANLLFDCLNEFDNANVDEIYSVIPKECGIGAAVYNRILKAAGHEIIIL